MEAAIKSGKPLDPPLFNHIEFTERELVNILEDPSVKVTPEIVLDSDYDRGRPGPGSGMRSANNDSFHTQGEAGQEGREMVYLAQ